MIIRRDIYLNRLISEMNNGMIKVITGIRRCGKSYLLFELFSKHLLKMGVRADHIIKIPLDDDDYSEYRNPERLYEYIKESATGVNGKYYVFIDEAQYAITKEELKNQDKPIRLYGVLNGLLHKKNMDVYITGSNSKFLSSDVMTEFRGRGDEIHIAPLSFSEYVPAYGRDIHTAMENYLYYGGLPYILQVQENESKEKYLQHLNSEIYLKDISERNNIKDDAHMDRIINLLASSVGSLTNPQRIADTFRSNGEKQLSNTTISNYLRYLQNAFIIERAERYDVKGRKYISTPSKYYFTDVGLRNAKLGFRQQETNHIMENVIYNELIFRGYNVDVGIVEVFDKNSGNRKQLEIDFVANKSSQRYYIQSALNIDTSAKRQQEERSLNNTNDSFKKIIVVRAQIVPWHTESGTLIIGIEQFLMDGNSMLL